eukprot:scaffold193961_cov13-Tisochrysis_lutea.AAC.1
MCLSKWERVWRHVCHAPAGSDSPPPAMRPQKNPGNILFLSSSGWHASGNCILSGKSRLYLRSNSVIIVGSGHTQ